MYTINLIKHKNDRPHGIENNIVGIIISMLFLLSVQLENVKKFPVFKSVLLS